MRKGDGDLAFIYNKMKINQVNPHPPPPPPPCLDGSLMKVQKGYQLKQKPGYHSESNVQNPLDNCLTDCDGQAAVYI